MVSSMKELLKENNVENKNENCICPLGLFNAMRNFYEFGVNEVYVFSVMMSIKEFTGNYTDFAKMLGFRINGTAARLALLELHRFGLIDIEFKYTDEEMERHHVRRNFMTYCKLNDNWSNVITKLDLYSDVDLY